MGNISREMKHLRKNQKKILEIKKKQIQKLRMPLKECQQNEYTGEERIYDCDRLMETSKTEMQRETRMTRKEKKKNPIIVGQQMCNKCVTGI